MIPSRGTLKCTKAETFWLFHTEIYLKTNLQSNLQLSVPSKLPMRLVVGAYYLVDKTGVCYRPNIIFINI